MSEPANADGTVDEHVAAIAGRLGLDDATRQYADAIETEVQDLAVPVNSPSRTAAACVLMACRLRGTPLRVTVVADHVPVAKARILNELQRLSDELDVVVPLDDPATILENTCRELDLSEAVEARAIRLADFGDEAGVTSGVSPYTYAAAILYVVCSPTDADLSQSDIASHFDVSTATLRDRRDDLLEATGGRLFETQFPDAPQEAAALVDDLLERARKADWTTHKRFLGVLGGAWLYAAERYGVDSDVAELASLTGISESTVRARYEQFIEHIGAPTSDDSRG